MSDLKGLKRLTANAQRVLALGEEVAKNNNAKEYKAIHLFYAILSDKSLIIGDLFAKLGIDYEETKMRVNDELLKYSSETGVGKASVSEELKKVINDSIVIARELGTVYVGIEHLFLSIFKQTNLEFVQSINEAGINYVVVKVL